MNNAVKLAPVLLTLSLLSLAVSADDGAWQIFTGVHQELTDTALERLENDYFEVKQWGLLSTETTEWAEEHFYPTANDRNDAGVYAIDAHKLGRGDFDGDGSQDVVISWATFPHTLPRPAIAPTVLLNQSGALTLDSSIWSGAPPERVFSYHAGVEDFNLDGTDDFVLASFGTLERLADGSIATTEERISLTLSDNGN